MALCPFLLLDIFAGLFILTSGQGVNRPPTWNSDSYNILTQGISEATPIGTFLCQLQCIDPENDKIEYLLQTGDTVTVTSNGSVYLAKLLDYESPNNLGSDLAFTCVDINPATGLPIHARVPANTQISINDANDNAPEFQVSNAQGYAFSVNENAPIGTLVESSIQTKDKDRNVNAALSTMYLICNSPNATERENQPESSKAFCEKFDLSYSQIAEGIYSASIKTKGALDYETRPVYTSKIVAIDGPGLAVRLTSIVNIQINIQDISDQPPYFTNPADTATVSEGAAIGSIVKDLTVNARDGDTGVKRAINITIINDPKNAFDLTKATEAKPGEGIYVSQLIVRNQLDRETTRGAYYFVVQATELENNAPAQPLATATATYSVYVLDIDDNKPTFTQDVYTVNVTEVDSKFADGRNLQMQITGLQMICYDLDEGINAMYNVSIVQVTIGTGSSQTYLTDAYSISPDLPDLVGNTSLYLKVDNPKYLDYDNPPYRVQTIVIVARETRTKEQFSGSTTVIIYLQDINDNDPVFQNSSYQISVSEAVSTFPTYLMTIVATDADSGANGQVTYSLEGGVSGKFAIDSTTGDLSLISALDYETASQYVLVVVATDMGAEPKSTQVQVTVYVTNVNDVAPKFRQSQYRTSVNESSLFFLNPIICSATDIEDSSNITYRIVSGKCTNDACAINPTTGELYLLSYLDFADTPKDANGVNTGVFVLVVEASDNGVPSQTATVNVSITVIDENNHGPVLNPVYYRAVLSEIAPTGTSVAQIMGKDDDSGENGKLYFRLGAGSTDNFAVNETTGLVSVGLASFDYDLQNEYNLTIIATDGGAPQQSAVAYVYVTITDSNNKDPSFPSLIYVINTDDRNPVGSIVLSLTPTDMDSTKSLECNIVNSEIKATGPNGAPLTTNVPYDYLVAFGVSQNCSVYIANKLDHNIMPEITFPLRVTDKNTEKGRGYGETQIFIYIKGAIDKSLTFDTINQVFMNEDVKVGYSPITVTARDPNKQPSTDYEKISGSDYFGVNQTSGKVTLLKEIDYETDVQRDHLHILTIVAYSLNRTQSATGTVTISIVDINDNAPMFLQKAYTAMVSENARFPQLVISVSAVDIDSNSYGLLDFSLVGLGAEDFQIFPVGDSDSQQTSRQGDVIVANNVILNYNNRKQYDLSIIVSDNQRVQSGVHQSNSSQLTIYIIDENNNYPTFTETIKNIDIADTTAPGTIIATLVATDDDQGLNGQVVYALGTTQYDDSATGVHLFSIDRDTGILIVAQSLLENSDRMFHLQVQASDRGDIPKRSIMLLNIYVSNTENNDGTPKWFYPPTGYIFYAPEETFNYTIMDRFNRSRVFNVTARTGKDIIFSLYVKEPYSNKFSINGITGEITVIGKLDREVQEDYDMLVTAADTSNVTLYKSGRSMILRLLDIDDNSPLFTNPKNYKSCQTIDYPEPITVEENMPANVIISTLSACDPDSPEFSKVVYQLYNGTTSCAKYNSMSGVTVTPTGQLVTLRTIDYEQDQEFKLCVQALPDKPTSGRRKRAFNPSEFQPYIDNVAYVYILVGDENDNAPKFTKKSISGIVQTDPGPDPITVLDCVDVDGPNNNRILYRIENSVFYPQGGAPPSPFDGAFRLGDRGEVLHALSSYQPYSGGHFVLKVVATDSANNSLTDSQEITIYVHEKGQAVKVILNLTPDKGSQFAQPIIKELNDVSEYHKFIFLRVSEHITEKTFDNTRSDICMLVTDTQSQDILNIRQVIDLLGQSRYQNVLGKSEYQFIDEGQCYPSRSSESNIKWRNLWWVLVAVAIFVFVCCVILIILVCILYDRYKRFMETHEKYMVPHSN